MNLRDKELRKYVTPAILEMVCIFLFSIIDGIFVGRGIGTNAMGAVGISFPFVMAFTALTMMTTTGGLTVFSIRQGRGDTEGTKVAFTYSMIMTLLVSIIFCVTGVCLFRQVSMLLGANSTYLDMCGEYIFWYSVFLIPCGLGMATQGFVRNDGNPVLVSAAIIFSTIINIVGDWIMIFPLKMGLKGAAIATGVSQTVGFLVTCPHFFSKKSTLGFRFGNIDGKLIKTILIRGTPECVSEFSVPVSLALTNTMLINYIGDTAVNAYSIICNAASLAAAVFAGTAEGIQPLLGRSYGAKEEDDLKYYYRKGIEISVIGAAVISVGIIFSWRWICGLFGIDESTYEVSRRAVIRYEWGFIMQAVTVIISSYLYSTTKTGHALTINILRSFVVNTVVILLLPRIFGPEIIWYSFGIFEGIVLVIAIILRRHADRHGIIGAAKE